MESSRSTLTVSRMKVITVCLGLAVACMIFLYLTWVQFAPAHIPHSSRKREKFKNTDSGQKNLRICDALSTCGKRVVIYNRVGKCGSRAIIQLARGLARDNGFNVISAPNDYNSGWRGISLPNQLKIVNLLDQQKQPFFFNKHYHYFNFERFGRLTPIHINLIRDPLSRLVSNYYYRRYGDGRHRSWNFTGSEKSKNMTFDECVLTNQDECVKPDKLFYIVPYFCGKCSKPSSWALRQALDNVTKRYLVVGILEEVDDFVKVLEKLLPEFFRGAWRKWKNPSSSQENQRKSTQTQHKKTPSSEVVKIMKQKMKIEYQFYEFVKREFHQLKRELQIKT